MKKKTILMVMLLMCCLAGTAYAADVTVTVDGKELAQKGVIVDGRTMVPIRDIAEAMGVDVEYDASKDIVSLCKDGQEFATMYDNIYMKKDISVISKQYVVSGSWKLIDCSVPIQNINGKKMVPVKVISEMLDADISWDGISYIASVTQKPKSTVTANGKIDLMGGLNKHDRGEYGRPMSEMGFEVIELYTEPERGGSGRWVKCKFDNVSGEEIAAAVYIVVFDKETGNLVEAGARDYSDAWKIDGGWIKSEIFYKYDPNLHEVDVIAK